MIGSFFFSVRPPDGVVELSLVQEEDGARMGEIGVPAMLLERMRERRYPLALDSLPLETALGYAIVIALKASIPLVLTGDRTAWNSEWGHLIDLPVSRRFRLVSSHAMRTH